MPRRSPAGEVVSNIERQLKALHLIATDMEADAALLDVSPFDAPTVARNLGQMMAAIAALASIVHAHIEVLPSDERPIVEPEQDFSPIREQTFKNMTEVRRHVAGLEL